MRQLCRLACPTVVLILLALTCSLGACSKPDAINDKRFVGKWKSSRATTPLYLNADGSWELRTGDGAVLQYGVWEYKNKQLVWIYKANGGAGVDPCPVLQFNERQFTLREKDGSTTTFDRLD